MKPTATSVLLLLALAGPYPARADTSAGNSRDANATILLSFHSSIGAPPPEDYTIDVHADGLVEVTVRMTYRRHRDGSLETFDLNKKPRVKSLMVTKEELEPLRKLLDTPEVAGLQPEYKGSTWDVGSYGLSFVDSTGKARSVTTSMLAMGQLPPQLQNLMSEARKLAHRLIPSH